MFDHVHTQEKNLVKWVKLPETEIISINYAKLINRQFYGFCGVCTHVYPSDSVRINSILVHANMFGCIKGIYNGWLKIDD